jgi:hypothetical protein
MLAACGLPVAQTASPAQQQHNQATQAAHIVETEIARSSRTPTLPPTSTHTPTPPPSETPSEDATPVPPVMRVTPQPGLELYQHADIPDYLFQINPARWQIDPSGETADLVHKTIANCRVESVPGSGLGAPQRLMWQDFGRFRWEIMDYGKWAYAYPVLGAGLVQNQNSFLQLQGYGQQSCRMEQEKVLSNLMTRLEADGSVQFIPFQSPTPRPALENFICPDTPPARLRIGDEVSIITNGLWMRSEPRVDNSTRVRQFLRYAPYMVRVIGGPVCEKYIYWEVEVVGFGEAGESKRGWLAEGDLQEYYLQPVK